MIFESDRCAQEIQEARQRAEALLVGLTPEQFTIQPEAGKWSVAECILHLNVTASVMQRLMESAMAQGRQEKKLGPGPADLDRRAAAEIQNTCAATPSSSCPDR
jgi:hypothetical protein